MPGSKRDANPPNQDEGAESTHVRQRESFRTPFRFCKLSIWIQERAIPGHRASTENTTTRKTHKHDIGPGWKEHVESG